MSTSDEIAAAVILILAVLGILITLMVQIKRAIKRELAAIAVALHTIATKLDQ